MPARARDSMGLRPRKAQSSSRFTVRGGSDGGPRLSPSAADGAKPRLPAAPEVRQPAGDPPGPGLLVPAPGLAVAQPALGHGVAVDQAYFHLAHHASGVQVPPAARADTRDMHTGS